MHPLLTEAIARDHRARLAQDAAPRHVRPIRRRGLRLRAQALVASLRPRRRANGALVPSGAAAAVEGSSCC